MDPNLLLAALAMVCASMYVIKFACDSFEGASDYLGTKVYKMAPGVRGASIEAAASSLPEFFTTLFLLFVYHDQDGFSAGIATCAGSAIFNAAVIPAVCILAVTSRGVNGQPVTRLSLGKRNLIRDAFFFLMAELLFIYFLGYSALTWWMGVVLMAGYCVYAAVLMRGIGGGDEVDDEDDEDDEDESRPGFFKAVVTFDFNHLLFGGQDFTARRAWIVLGAATLAIAVACYLLAEAVMLSAKALEVPALFTAVILGAAASSVPDTYISYKNALKGDYDDAVSNAFGSNVFDICFALGLPLALYGLIYGDVPLAPATEGGAGIVELCVALVILSLFILAIFLVAKSGEDDRGRKVVYVGMGRGYCLMLIYALWTTYVVGRAMEWPWLAQLVG